jgi:hypothetical protein
MNIVELNNQNIGKVDSDAGTFLTVWYLAPTKKMYKGAKILSFEEESELIEVDQVKNRYGSMEDVGFLDIGDNMFVEKDEIDEDSDSEVEESDDEGEWTEDDDFIVPDDEDVLIKPPDHRHVDAAWNSWRPATPGAKRFKDKIDQIEAYMNHQIDEKFVF